MPGFNRTGPSGEGPKTGRGLGKCNPNSPLNKNQTEWKGSGFGRNTHFETGTKPNRRSSSGPGNRNNGRRLRRSVR